AEVVVARVARLTAGGRGVALGGAAVEDDARERLAARFDPPAGPDREHALAPAGGPAEAAVHLGRARTGADAADRDRLGQAHGGHAGSVGALDPERDLRAPGRGEVQLDAARGVLGGGRARRERESAEHDPQSLYGSQHGNEPTAAS